MHIPAGCNSTTTLKADIRDELNDISFDRNKRLSCPRPPGSWGALLLPGTSLTKREPE